MRLTDATALTDLLTYLSRADRIDRASARLVADQGVLAVYTAVLHPAGLLDATPTVLGLRTMAAPAEDELDEVVPIASLTARLQGLHATSDDWISVPLPAPVHTVTWSGIAPPRTGWVAVDQVSADTMIEVARAGSAEVAEALSGNTGEKVVQRVRTEVWGRPIPGLEHVPAGASFAAATLGFVVDPLEQIPVYESGPWTRLSAERGHVLVKRKGWSLLS